MDNFYFFYEHIVPYDLSIAEFYCLSTIELLDSVIVSQFSFRDSMRENIHNSTDMEGSD